MSPETTDSWEEWVATWRPIRPLNRPRRDDSLEEFLFDHDRPEHAAALRELAGANGEHLWTLRDGGGMALTLSAGYHFVDRMGYLLTERAHDGYEATPVLVMGDPDIYVVPNEMTDDELREALDEYEEDAAQPGEAGRIGRKNLDLLLEEKARRWG